MTDPEFVIRVLRGICIAIYAPMLPVIFIELWLERKHPVLHKRILKWLRLTPS